MKKKLHHEETDRGNSARRIGTIVSQLMSRRGYASVASDNAMTGSIAQSVGPTLAGSITVGKLSRGVLHVYAVDSVVMQELTFQKRKILKALSKDHPQAKITDIRFRLQSQVKS
ncbi:DUF721 domain-containing protein [Allorhodopirellula heiligendammensis]|uniref:DUF721 domain-containing protein n=1 Tax=Allorhodopirellula heiligendammensis TaxID=2714739 RepID=A0A5C6C4I7_9BACT|nr:DUF721 domain-containing protein [Allorhodopirellula heiligendammensis]TWU18907.1 hypothetical protein Poly21_10780 [Allorhodopirellula heiligendammensis]|tara:strand:+ start:476 stop:817 length:342 start_codon:yes stop_codon:yes gene_type:complete